MFTNRPAIAKPTPGDDQNRAKKSEQTADSDASKKDIYHIRDRIQRKLLDETDGEINLSHRPQMQQLIESLFNQVLTDENLLYTRATRSAILEWCIADILGYGPIEPLLQDNTITEVMVNGPHNIYIEREGRIEFTDVKFEDDAHLMRIIERIVSPIGRRVDEASPMVDARLPSGFRVNATIPPLSLDGPVLTIRKFATTPFTAQDLIANGTMTNSAVEFLRACVEARVNMIVSGGTGTGKTTLLNVLSAFIPLDERVITIEDTAELQLKQPHVVRMEKRPPNIEGRGEVPIRALVVNALRMRPDRIIVGESRSSEAVDMLQAMNTGHDGSMTTIHSNSPRDTLRRVETMVLMAGLELPLKAIREQVASAVDLVVHVDRLRDGTRKIVKITEVQGMEGETIVLQDLFQFEQTAFNNGRVIGSLVSTGLRPTFDEKFEINNIEISQEIYERGRVMK